MDNNTSHLLQIAKETGEKATSQGKNAYEASGAQLSAVISADDWGFLTYLKDLAEYSKRIAKENGGKEGKGKFERIEALKNSKWWKIKLVIQRIKDELFF